MMDAASAGLIQWALAAVDRDADAQLGDAVDTRRGASAQRSSAEPRATSQLPRDGVRGNDRRASFAEDTHSAAPSPPAPRYAAADQEAVFPYRVERTRRPFVDVLSKS
jgi:hypothetical protein